MDLLECDIPERKLNKDTADSFCLKDILFQLESGYIMGVIGENGAGKTTLLKCLMGGMHLSAEQKVTICGHSMMNDAREAKKHMAFVMAECPFPQQLSIRDNVKIFALLYENWDDKTFEKWSRHFALDENIPLKKLSKGQQIRFQLAFALSYDASLYFMDEPSGNLDVEFREEFYQILRELVSTGTKSVILATQLVEELDGLADYILWLNQGKQQLFLDMEQLQERFVIVSGLRQSIEAIPPKLLVGQRLTESHNEALIDEAQGKLMLPLKRRRARIEEIMFYSSGGDRYV